MDVNKQIQRCLHELNILRDLVNAERFDNWDLGWQLDRIRIAQNCVETLEDKNETIGKRAGDL